MLVFAQTLKEMISEREGCLEGSGETELCSNILLIACFKMDGGDVNRVVDGALNLCEFPPQLENTEAVCK